MTKRKLFALLFLATFVAGLLAGPHPCRAAHEKRESRQASCHHAAESPQGPQSRLNAPSPSCCDAFCQAACHVMAVAIAVPVAFAISPVSQATGEPAPSEQFLVSFPIDHIPLS